MTVVGICMVRDEADIIGHTVGHMLEQVDSVIVADNGSVDGTRDILAELPITVVDDPEVAYYQSQKMTKLAHQAAADGATWVVPFDADEWWHSPFHERIAELVVGLAPQWLTAAADLYDHVATNADLEDEPNPTRRMLYRRRQAAPLRKVACRVRADMVIEQGNHGCSYDGGTTHYEHHLVVRHFPYRSAEQFVRKARNGAEAYAATDLPDEVGQHWRSYGRILATEGEEALQEVFRRWFWVRSPDRDPSLIYDPAP